MPSVNESKRVRCLKLFGVITKQSNDGSWLHTNGDICYYNDAGDYHREDGPAVININNNVRWFYCDTEYRFSNWCYKVGCSDEAKMMLRLRYG